MIRLLTALGVFLFMGLWFLGEDHGQFINPPRSARPQMTSATQDVRPVFIPARPVIEAVVAPEPAVAPEPPAPAAQLEPQLAGIKLMHVPGGASVRGGPGRQYGVIGGLNAGDSVMVIDDSSAPGWVRIRVDGRGEGWVAAKLLRE